MPKQRQILAKVVDFGWQCRFNELTLLAPPLPLTQALLAPLALLELLVPLALLELLVPLAMLALLALLTPLAL